MVIFDSTDVGTAAADWKSHRAHLVLPALDLSSIDSLCVVSAHPDDETLGAGGLIAACAQREIPVRVVVVTDGAASHPGSRTTDGGRLASLRQRELYCAIAQLAPECEITMLGFPDGETDLRRNEIRAALGRILAPGTTVVAPWRGDGHRDHRVVAETCAEIAHDGADLLEYPIWMWHWASPVDEGVPWNSAVSLPLDWRTRQAKLRAISEHVSQVAGLGSGDGDGPVLSAGFLSNFDSETEVFFIAGQ